MAEKHVHKVYGSFPPWGKSVEFPTGGGGSGGGLAYFDTMPLYGQYYYPEIRNIQDEVRSFSYIVKESDGNGYTIFTHATFALKNNLYAVGIDLNAKISRWDDDVQDFNGFETIESNIKRYAPWVLELPRITEEEFYYIPMFISFTNDDIVPNGNIGNTVPFKYDEGMTWREWLSSPYNTLEELGFPVEVRNWEGEETLWGTNESALTWTLWTPSGDRPVHPDDVIRAKAGHYQMRFPD